MKTKITICISVLAMVLQGNVFAVTKEVEADSFCPHISQIQKNQMTQKWGLKVVGGAWKSYQTSFATDLTQFLGAQWTGVGLGQVTCIYKAEQRFTIEGKPTIQPALPVTLAFNVMVLQPTKGKWERIPHAHGVYNCYAIERADCPFKIHTQQLTQDIYQEAESLKMGNDNALQPESY